VRSIGAGLRLRNTVRMINTKISAALLGATLVGAFALTGCAGEQQIGGVPAPITMSTDELQGATVDLPINTVLNITTGSLAVDSYTADVADPSVAEFVQGYTTDTAEFNPGIKPLKEGTTEVVLTNEQGGIQPVTFTVVVVPAP
jgi:hypothetical protein